MACAEPTRTVGERLEGLVWPLVVMLILVAANQYSYALDPKDGPFILYADVFAVAVFGLWALAVLLRRRVGEIPRPPVAIWALIVVAVLSALGATSLKSAAVEIAQLVLYFVAVWMLFADVLRGPHRLVIAAKALALATTVAVLIALGQYIVADDPMLVRGTFANRNVYGGFLTMVLPLLYGLAIWTRDGAHRAWFLVIIVLGALTMLAGLQFWCLALVLLVVSALKSLRTLGYYLLCASVFLALALMVLPRNRMALFTEVTDPIERGEVHKLVVGPGEEPPVLIKKRWLEWQPALTMITDNALLGVGAGNYQKHIGEGQYYGMLPNAKKTEPDTNNLYLVIGGSMGFVGLAAFMAWLGHFWRRADDCRRAARDHWAMGLCWGLMGSVYGIVLVNIFTSLFVRGSSLVWALLFAMIASVNAHGLGGIDVSADASKDREEVRREDSQCAV